MLQGNVPKKHKAVAKDQYEKGRKYLTEEYFPKDRQDQFVYRLKKVVVECQAHPKYKDALEWFLQTRTFTCLVESVLAYLQYFS